MSIQFLRGGSIMRDNMMKGNACRLLEYPMVQTADFETEGKMVAILKVLSEFSKPLGSITIARELEHQGIFLSERAVRYHLRIADERGYTRPTGRDGRVLTTKGLEEIKEALAPQHLGFVRENLEMLAFQTSFDVQKRTGQLPINTSIIDKASFKKALSAMKEAYEAGICVSDLVATASEGERLGSMVIPGGKIGLATVCSVVLNGVMLKAGVPTEYRFGGVLEVRNFQPRRFVAVIDYNGTSLDPSEQFIRAKMTSVRETATTGNGKVLGVFRTVPAPAKAIVEEKIALLREASIGGVFAIGNTSEPLCQIPVGLNRVGIVQLGGLNPVAAAVEAGVEIESMAESGLIDFEQLQSFWQL
jgi:repressor of nif and glnA expression